MADLFRADVSGFQPVLLKAEVSADLVNPGHHLLVTTWWQNIGGRPAAGPLRGFLDLELGHQRKIETTADAIHVDWTPLPGPQCWQPGEVWATTCQWEVKVPWGGSYELFVGLYDSNHVPVTFIGAGGQPAPRVSIGVVEIGWGYGEVSIVEDRKPIVTEFNAPTTFPAATDQVASISIADQITARFDERAPILLEIGDGHSVFRAPSVPPFVEFRQITTDTFFYSTSPACIVEYALTAREGQSARYHALVRYQGAPVAEWDIQAAVQGRRLSISMENVCEAAGFELINLTMPSLVTAGDDASLVDVFLGGRLVAVKDTPPMGYVHPYDVRNALGMYDPRGTVVIEAPGLDDKTVVSVQQNGEGKHGALGVLFTYRVPAKGAARPSLQVMNAPLVTVTVLDAAAEQPGWQAVARFLRLDARRAESFPLYDHTLVHKVLVNWGPKPSETHSDTHPVWGNRRETHRFSEVLERVRRISNLIDGGRQICYVGGWEYEGYDTGYPYIEETDPRAGTVEELRQLIADAAQYNAVITMHDNYDDCFPSPHLDPSILSLDERGEIWEGWIWAGGMSYATSIKKAMALGKIQRRIDRTIELYGIHTSYHLDVLSSEILRWDFDPACRAAADVSMAAKIAMIKEFNKHGIDITSESLAHPLVGHMSHAYGTRDNPQGSLFPGDAFIPLMSMIYHGTMHYLGMRGDGSIDFLTNLLRGANGFWSETFEEKHADVKHYYLTTLPLGFLEDKPMLDIKQDGKRWFVDYGDGSYVRVDFAGDNYELAVNGRIYGHDWTTFAPGVKPGSWLAYSAKGGAMSYPAPEQWSDGMALRAVTLTADGEGEPIAAVVRQGQVELTMLADVPVRVTQA